MRPWLRYIIVFFAYGMALLHTAVPHHHEAPSQGTVVIARAGCHLTHSTNGILQMVFSTDLGYGHLEVFKKSADTSFQFSAAASAITAIVVPVVAMPESTPVYSGSHGDFISGLHQRLLLFSVSLFRGPPVGI